MDTIRAVKTTPLFAKDATLRKGPALSKHLYRCDEDLDNLDGAPIPDQPQYMPDPRDDTDPLAPPEQFRRMSYEAMDETYELRRKCLRELKDKIAHAEDKHRRPRERGSKGRGEGDGDAVHFGRKDDAFLMVFLRSRRFRVDAAFKKLVNYSKAHTMNPWLNEIDISLVERLFTNGSFQVLPSHDPKGRLILSMDMKVLIPFVEELDKDNSQHLMTVIFAMLETIMQDMRAQMFGTVIVADLTSCKLKTFGYLSLSQYLLALELCQHCYPLRANGMFLIHEPWYVRGLFNVMRPFMKPSVKECLLCFGTDVAHIHKFIPKESLISTYGGTLQFDSREHSQRWVEAVRNSARQHGD